MTARRKARIAVQQIEPQAARACAGRKSDSRERLSRSTAKFARGDVGAALRVVARHHFRSADIAAGAIGFDRQFGDRRGVAQAEIEPLRADRREAVRGFADQCNAAARQNCVAVSAASGKKPRPGSSVILPRIECERASISSSSAASSRCRKRSASPGSTTQTMLERRPGSGTMVKGPFSVWNSVEMSRCGRVWRTLKVRASCG